MSKKNFQIPIFLGIANVWFGAHSGPGAVSGKQIAIYYSTFGKWGFITPIFAMGVMSICIYYALEYSRIKGITNFKDFSNSFFQPYEKFFSTLFEATFLVTLLMAVGGSFAAGAGMLHQYLGLPILVGTGFLILISILLSMFGDKLVRTSSTMITIFKAICLFTIIVAGLLSPKANFMTHWRSTSLGETSLLSAFVMSMVYAGFLTAGNMANAVSVSNGLSSKKDSVKSAVLGFIMNLVLVLSMVFLLFAYPQFIGNSLPNLSVVTELAVSTLLFAYIIMVTLAVLSTVVSYSFATVARYSPLLPMKEGSKRDFVILLILLMATFFISLLGLDVIIGKGYKYLGYLVIPTVIIPTLLLGRNKILSAEKIIKQNE